MSNVVGMRRETKSNWERRAPLTPRITRKLVTESDLEILVQPSPRRVFRDKEYVRAGATLTNDLSEARVIFGVKEVPPELLQPDTAYVYFSHVIKGQHYNMPMLARLMELGCTLIDYETVCDDNGSRLIFFGRFAGLAGMIDTLWALGARLESEGLSSPFTHIAPAHTYGSLDEAKEAVHTAGEEISRDGLDAALAPLVIGVAGYGNVARGAREILSKLPTREVAPHELDALRADDEVSRRHIVVTTFREEHLVTPRDPERAFELQDYYRHPERYRGAFGPHLDHLSVLMNCNYWDKRYPRLVTLADIERLYRAGAAPKLRVIGDLGCDIGGAVECTVRATEPGDPVYVYDPAAGTAAPGVEGHGPVVLAVDILPAELPRDASEEFSNALGKFIPAVAAADLGVSFADLELPAAIKRAVIVHRGELTPDYAHLAEHLKDRS